MENVTLEYAGPKGEVRVNAMGIGGVLLAAFGVSEMGLGGWLGLSCAFACLLGAVGAFGLAIHGAGVAGQGWRKWNLIWALLLVCAIGVAYAVGAELQMIALRELLSSVVRDPLRVGGRALVLQRVGDGVRCLTDLMLAVLCGMGTVFMRRVGRLGGPRGVGVVSVWALGLVLLLLVVGTGVGAAGVLMARATVLGGLVYDNPYVSIRNDVIDAARAMVALYGVGLAVMVWRWGAEM